MRDRLRRLLRLPDPRRWDVNLEQCATCRRHSAWDHTNLSGECRVLGCQCTEFLPLAPPE